MSFKIGNLKFIDSFQFLTGSLEKLVDSLKLSDSDIYKNFHNMKKHFKRRRFRNYLSRKVYTLTSL
jgi:hypothetical protein